MVGQQSWKLAVYCWKYIALSHHCTNPSFNKTRILAIKFSMQHEVPWTSEMFKSKLSYFILKNYEEKWISFRGVVGKLVWMRSEDSYRIWKVIKCSLDSDMNAETLFSSVQNWTALLTCCSLRKSVLHRAVDSLWKSNTILLTIFARF